MADRLWETLLKPQHPWTLGEDLRRAVGAPGLPRLDLADLYHWGWDGDPGEAMELLQTEGDRLVPELRILLWAGIALQVRLADVGGTFRYCLAACRAGDELGAGSGLRILAGLLEGHWNAARRISPDLSRRLGETIEDGLVNHHQVLQLALRGLASPLLRERSLLTRIAPSAGAWADRIRFYDAAECGRTAEALALIPTVVEDGLDRERHLALAYAAIVRLQRQVLGRETGQGFREWEGPSAPWMGIGSKGLERSVRFCYLTALGSAEECTQEDQPESTEPHLLTPSGHFAVIPIRMALARGRPEEAAALLSRRRAAGVSTFLDRVLDLRRLLQQGDRTAAALVAAALTRDREAYDCRGRIEFELRAAREIQLLDLLSVATPSPTTSVSASSGAVPDLVGASPAIVRVRDAVTRFAPVDLAVLIRGPSGTGKDLVARALHEASPRAKRPFIAVNCAALAEGLLESELFGHAKGAFSGASAARGGLVAAAGDGTLFLDEIGEISRHFQAALLRLLETGDYRPVGADAARGARCRIVAATNADLAGLVAAGEFREDLFHRLCRLEIVLPALADHIEDIDLLVPHLLRQIRGGRPAEAMPDLLEFLRRRAWPGNVRELRNRLEAMVVLHPHLPRYGLEQFGDETRARPVPQPRAEVATAPPVLLGGDGRQRRIADLEALLREHGRLTRVEVAHLLGISTMTATAYLKDLCQRGVARKIMPNAAPRSHYFVPV